MNANNATSKILNTLDRFTLELSIEQLLSELQLAIERIDFSSQQLLESAKTPSVLKSNVSILLEDQISPSMMEFIRWLIDNNLFKVLIGDTGVLFLNYCIQQYKQISQIHFISAIQLDSNMKIYVRNRLVAKYGTQSRVVFETSPAIVAGFILQVGGVSINRSLRDKSQVLISRCIKEYVKKIQAEVIR